MFMNFFEYLKDFTDTAKERIKTPITGAFTISFIIYNWRPILLILLSEQDIETKICYINRFYSNYDAFLVPVFIAIMYVICVPCIMVYLEKLTKRAISERKGHQIDLRKDDATKREELYKQLRRNEIARSGFKDLEEAIDENKLLKVKIEQIAKDATTNIENLSKAHASAVKNYESTIEKLAASDKITQEKNDELTTTLQKKEYFLDELYESIGLKSIIPKFDPNEIQRFLNFYNEYSKNPAEAFGQLSELRIQQYLRTGLIERIETDQMPIITPLGNALFHYIEVEKTNVNR